MTAAAAPPLLRLAAALVALEGLGLVGLGVLYGVRGLVDDAESVAGTELAAVAIIGLGVLLLLVARGLLQRRRWARSPALVVQLLGALTAFSLAQGRVWVAAAVVGVLAVGTLACLFSAPVREALELD